MNSICDNCGKEIPPKAQIYAIRIELFARADPVVIELQDLLDNPASKMEELLKQLEDADPDEAADQVHESYTFDLCPVCRMQIHRQLKARDQQNDNT